MPNQFALPRSEGGGTRHIDLFGRLDAWEPLIVAANRNHATQRPFHTDDRRFHLVWAPEQHGGRLARVAGWVIYALEAFFITVTRRRLDAVYGSSPHLLAPLAGLIAAKLRGVPFVLEVRDLWPESIVAAGMLRPGSRLHRILARLERWLALSADAIVVVTAGWEEHFAEMGVPPSKLTVISNGAEPDDFVVDEPRATLRAAYDIDGFTAVFAGSHGPKDGVDLILDAAEALPGISFLLIGGGSAKAAAMADTHRRRLANVEFREPVPKADLARLLGACDLGIHAVSPLTVFDHGMSPNKLFDYMAAGLPIVSNAKQGLRTVIPGNECGPVGGPESLAVGIRTVYEASDEQRAHWGRRGRELVRDRFSRSAAAVRLEALMGSTAPHVTRTVKAPRVAHVTTAHRPTDGRIMRKECTALAEAGVDTVLVAVSDRNRTVNGVHIHALPRRSGRLGRMLLGPVDAWRALRVIRPSLIHVHDPELIPLAVAWRLWPGRKAVYDAHEDLPKQVAGKRYIPGPLRPVSARVARIVEVMADRNLDAIVAATPSIGRNYTHSRVVLVQNFPWLRDYPEPAESDSAAPNEAVYVGALTLERGLDVMIGGVKASHHCPRLVLAGRADACAAKAISDESSSLVTHLGSVAPGDIPAILARSRVGLVVLRPLPNYVESQPTKLFEYMAAGRPFVASDFPLWRQMLGPFDCGLFVNPLDPTELAAALDALLEDPTLAQLMGARGRRALAKHFTFERETAALLRLTQDLTHA